MRNLKGIQFGFSSSKGQVRGLEKERLHYDPLIVQEATHSAGNNTVLADKLYKPHISLQNAIYP